MQTYAIVGTGGRSMMFTEAFIKYFKDHAKLLAMCDINQGKARPCGKIFKARLRRYPVLQSRRF